MDEQSLPIDIHYNKMLDWLLDRRHCPPKWHQRLQEIAKRVSDAVQRIPRSEPRLRSLAEKDGMCYLDCKEVLDCLLQTEPKDKNILGQYTASKLREWNDIVKLYEKSNLHLVESAQILARNVNYEIPSLKQQLASCQQQQNYSCHRAAECRQSALALKEKFELSCQEIGIQGANVHAELAQLLQKLPMFFSEIVALLPSLQPAISYYEQFLQFINPHTPGRDVLKPLHFLVNHGNVTAYEWEHGHPPSLSPTLHQEEDHPTRSSTWSQPGSGDPTQALVEGELEIDWTDVVEETSAVQSDIDFDISLEELQITLEEAGEEESENTESQTAPSLSSAPAFPSLLEDTSCRNAILDDLYELLEFFQQRSSELSSESAGLLQVESDLPETLQLQTSSSVGEMLACVTQVIDKLTDKHLRQLLHIQSSESYLSQLAESLLHHLRQSQKLLRQAESYTTRASLACSQERQEQQKLNSLVAETKRIEKMAAAEISKKYNQRTVNIMGAITSI